MDVKSPEQTISNGERLATAIAASGFRKDFVAATAGINPSVLSGLITGGRHLTIRYADKLAPVLGVTAGYLMGNEELPGGTAA